MVDNDDSNEFMSRRNPYDTLVSIIYTFYLYYSITRRGRDTLIEIGVRKLAGAYLDADD